MYNVLHTLIFVVTDKLSAGEPDLLWHTWGAHIFTVSARQEPEQPDTNVDSSQKGQQLITYSTIFKDFPPLFKGNDDEVSVQSKNTKGQETLDKKKKKRENYWIATLTLLLKGIQWYLSIVCDSTEEL